jgi:PIN domain nuclease of toxin-antitoxin system
VTRLLLDTHVFVWWVKAAPKITPAWLEAILDPANSVYVSAVTAWEIETKKRIKKLDFDYEVASVTAEFGFEQLAVTMDHAAEAGSLEWEHRDPFDRMLVAQARVNDMTLLTSDMTVKSAPGIRVL